MAESTKADIIDAWVKASNPGSLSNFTNFIRNNKWASEYSNVKKTLENFSPFSIHRPPKKETPRRRVLTTFKGSILAADLSDVREINPRINNGTKYILVIVEFLSKMVYFFPLKNKSGSSVSAAFDLFFKSNPEYRFSNIWSDLGTEFLASKTRLVLKKYNSQIYHTTNFKLKASPAERVIRTLKKKIYMYLEATKKKKYIHILKDIQNSLNDEYKPSIGMRPTDVKDPKSESLAWHNQYISLIQAKKTKQKIPLNSFVRILNTKISFFSKAYKASYGKPIFKVVEAIFYHPIYKYKLIDPKTNEILPLLFYDFELLVVPSEKEDE